MVQPGAWWLSRWWWRHRQHRLSALVAPAGQGVLWSRSQRIAAARQPGKRQRRSRARTNRSQRVAGAVAGGCRGRAEAGARGGWVQGRRPVRQRRAAAGGGVPDPGGVGEGEQLAGDLLDDGDPWQVGQRGAGELRRPSSSASRATAAAAAAAAGRGRRRRSVGLRLGGAARRRAGSVLGPGVARPGASLGAVRPRGRLGAGRRVGLGSGGGVGRCLGVGLRPLGVSGFGLGSGEQAEGVGEFADQGGGHGVAVDLAGLVAAGQRCPRRRPR